MSSNPFRRQPPTQLPLDATAAVPDGRAFEDAVNQALEDKGRKQSASKKTVRIQTPPPLSPDPVTSPSFGDPLIRRLSNEPRAGSPPPALPVDVPPATAALKLDPLGPSFGADVTPQDPQVIINTRRNSETGVSETASSPPTALAAKVLNPFQRTLANIEPQEEKGGDGVSGSADPAQLPESAAGPIDVNSFTKMLLTGQGGPTPAELNKKPASATDGSAGSSAQPGNIPHNFDELEDASSSEDGSPRAPRRDQGVRGAPPPPKHKHGKSISERAPQTVSFNNFEEDISTLNLGRFPSDEPARKTSDSDQSKRRLPPPPPSSRRPPSATFEGAGSSNQPILSPSASSSSKSTKPPPPPPARRGANRNSYQPDVTDRTLDTANLAEETFDPITGRRPTNTDQKPSSRSSSVSEQRNLPAPPPPPPTRRRRGSSKSSVENQPAGSLRTASEARRAADDNRRNSVDSARRASTLGQVEEDKDDAGTGKPAGDILADLSAFQAEVDALRSSYRKS